MNDEMRKLLEEREKTHGEFFDVAMVSQSIKDALRKADSWYAMEDISREALDMIASKMSRIVNGDHSFVDHWVDLVGYASLVVDRLRKNS